MTPFGQYLEQLRRSRKLQQSQLAAELDVSACYISAMEKGRKVPARSQILDKISEVLELDEQEQQSLIKSVEQSKQTLKVPASAGPEEYAFLNELWGHLGSLSADQIDGMSLFLKVGRGSQRRSY